MKISQKKIKIIKIFSLALFLVAGSIFAAAGTGTPPPPPPPNIIPINVGPYNQIKPANLIIQGKLDVSKDVLLSAANTTFTLFGDDPTGSEAELTVYGDMLISTVAHTAEINSRDLCANRSGVILICPASLSVSPNLTSVKKGESQIFSAEVIGIQDKEVKWSFTSQINGLTGQTFNDNTYKITVPDSATAGQTVTITAKSQADTTIQGTATLTVIN